MRPFYKLSLFASSVKDKYIQISLAVMRYEATDKHWGLKDGSLHWPASHVIADNEFMPKHL